MLFSGRESNPCLARDRRCYLLHTIKNLKLPYKIFQIIPETNKDLISLIKLHDEGELDFWRAPSHLNSSVDVMIPPSELIYFEKFLQTNDLKSKIIVEDLAKLIQEKEIDDPRHLFRPNRLIGRDDAGWNNYGARMGEYYSYNEIVAWMKRIEAANRNIVRVFSIGKTAEKRDIYGIKFGNPAENTKKRVVWIDGGIHAREWTAVHTAMYFIYSLINAYGKDTPLTRFMDNYNIVVFPCLNPDGYEFTRSDPRNPSVRMWRKSRSDERCANDHRGEKRCCKGVDLNRNFAYRFAETGTSYSPCSEIFHGAGAFSEPETRAVRDAIVNSELTGKIDALITLHAYSQLWIYPFSHQKFAYPEDIADLKAVAKKAVSEVGKLYGTHYMYGTGPEIIYAYTGGLSDWAKETAKIKYSYTIELRPSYFDWNGFILDKRQLIPTAREAFEGVKVVFDRVLQEHPPLDTPSDGCVDLQTACTSWLQSNPRICVDSRAAMLKDCRKSCQLC
ncbi:hypothetical protein L596_009993 [Steinernema carpocapsae]|uniref:Uncharacterized protein n=1 Tax=Steinernema carpocapsae TaxID=34508 RepID=A0A4U5PHG6_STECR|nr:hypothetical protein L596_009993 [Steinernema carpocapsae]